MDVHTVVVVAAAALYSPLSKREIYITSSILISK
jgi:hypothetical protein